jgi:hypothetical protein
LFVAENTSSPSFRDGALVNVRTIGLGVVSTDVADSLPGGLTDVGSADGGAVVDAIVLGGAVDRAADGGAIVVGGID